MSPASRGTDPTKTKLTKERVLVGALALADQIGMDKFTIRKLATELDTKPMTIYHHVPNKDAIIDGMVDLVFAEIDLPSHSGPWQDAIASRARSARAALGRHPWATPFMESRTSPGPATLTHHDAVIGCFRTAGFSIEMTAHAYALVDAFIYGFAMQEANLPATGGEEMTELAEEMSQLFSPEDYPHLIEFTVEHVVNPEYDFTDEFEFGLKLILDGLATSAAQLDD